MPDFVNLLSASTLDDESTALLRDGAEAFVGVLATVSRWCAGRDRHADALGNKAGVGHKRS